MKEAALPLFAYLIGSVPLAYGLGRALKNIDIRQYGSGSVGASNVWSQVSRWFAFPVGAFDLLVKGALPVYLAQLLDAGPWIVAAAGLAAVAGHNWSIYLRFTGGRGISVVMGVLLVLTWQVLAVATLVTALGWLFFRGSALWVGVGIASLPALSIVFGEPASTTALCVALVTVVGTKRLLANQGTATPGIRWRDVWLHRLLHDRDTASREDWVQRTPPKARGDG